MRSVLPISPLLVVPAWTLLLAWILIWLYLWRVKTCGASIRVGVCCQRRASSSWLSSR